MSQRSRVRPPPGAFFTFITIASNHHFKVIILENYWKLIAPLWFLSAKLTNNYRSYRRIVYPILYSPFLSSTAFKLPSRFLSKSLNALESYEFSWPITSFRFLPYVCVVLIDDADELFEVELPSPLNAKLLKHFLHFIICGLMPKSLHGFLPFLGAYIYTSTEMVPLLSVSNCAKISNSSLCSYLSSMEILPLEGSYLLDLCIASAKLQY